MSAQTKELIKRYYDAFNNADMKTFFALMDDNVIHDINQGKQETGKAAFQQFMEHMDKCYRENIAELVIFANDDGSRAAAEFTVSGIYLVTDTNFPEAKQQTYTLPAGAFFTIKNGKIARITNYYNVKNWIKQVSI